MGVTAIGIAGLALSAGGMVVQGIGQKKANEASAANAARAAEIARIQGTQLSADFQNELTTNLAVIRSIRASVGGRASPTEYAVLDSEAAASDRARRIRVSGVRMQATQYDKDASTYRTAARFSLLGGIVGAGATSLSGYHNMKTA